MKRHLNPSTLILSMLVLLMTMTCIICFTNAISWINKPFPGFLLYKEAFVGSFKSRDWPGIKAELKFVERIVAVDGQPIVEGQEVLTAVSRKKLNTPVHYLVKSKGKIREVIVPVSIFTIKDFFLVFFIVFLGGMIVYTFGIVVYALKPKMYVSWVFLLASLWLGTYMVSGFEIQSSYYLVRFHYLSLCLIPPTFFHLFLIFPDRKGILSRWTSLEYIIYVPSFLLVIGYQIYFSLFRKAWASNALSWVPGYAQLGSMIRAMMAFCMLSLIAFILHSIYKSSTTQARQRAKMILFGVTMALGPPATIMILAFLIKFNFPWNFFPFFIIFFPASIAYSIIKHNLFDADVIIKRTVGYVIVTCVIIGAYAGLSVSLNLMIGQFQLAQSQIFHILFTLGVILIFNPLRDRVQDIVNRVFFRAEYDYGAIIENIGRAMNSLLDLDQIVKRLTQTFLEDMFINSSSVMLLSSAGTEYRVFFAAGERKQDVENMTILRNDPIVEIIEAEKKELTKYDMIEDERYKAVSESSSANFEALHASLMVPLVFQDRVIGSLNLGEKKSGKFYNRQDIDLLRTLANQGAIAIENARLFKENLEKQRMEEELNIARDLQMSMLPSACPEIEGFEIVAYSLSAREVGGDFYDFIDMGEDKVGMIIGDVTGKSVSGALVMSASRSVFRMLSEENLSVGEIMIRANRRAKIDIKSGMFVALLYAVLNAKDKSLSLCSAGQTQPIHNSADTDETVLVETKGDTFPLGILDHVDYVETRLQLNPGDKVVLYTDGIVEAMNAQKEIFSFDRLLDIVKRSKSMTAELLLKKILYEVNTFSGSVDQHDDITVIVVRAE